MDFETVDEIKSGWTTFKYINKSFEPHFFILEKMPDTLGLTTYKKDLFPPFISAFEHFEKGEMEAGMKEFEKIPQWFYKVEFTDLGPFRAVTYDALMRIDMQDKTFGWTVEMQVKAAKQKMNCTEIPVDYRVRIGKSKVSGTLKGTVMAGYKIITTIFKYR